MQIIHFKNVYMYTFCGGGEGVWKSVCFVHSFGRWQLWTVPNIFAGSCVNRYTSSGTFSPTLAINLSKSRRILSKVMTTKPYNPPIPSANRTMLRDSLLLAITRMVNIYHLIYTKHKRILMRFSALLPTRVGCFRSVYTTPNKSSHGEGHSWTYT